MEISRERKDDQLEKKGKYCPIQDYNKYNNTQKISNYQPTIINHQLSTKHYWFKYNANENKNPFDY